MTLTHRVSWSVMTLGAVGIGLYALAQALAPGLRGEFVQNMLITSTTGSVLHFLMGSIVIIIGALQFHSGLRRNFPAVHRWFGRVYVAGALAGGFSGLFLAFYSTGGIVGHWGFGLLAVCWIVTTGAAFIHIRAGRITSHQIWMIRSYSLTLAALTLRLYLPISQIAGIEFEAAYQAIAWFCWVPNLIIAEWFFIARLTRPASVQLHAAV